MSREKQTEIAIMILVSSCLLGLGLGLVQLDNVRRHNVISNIFTYEYSDQWDSFEFGHRSSYALEI